MKQRVVNGRDGSPEIPLLGTPWIEAGQAPRLLNLLAEQWLLRHQISIPASSISERMPKCV